MEKLGKNYLVPEEREVLILPGNRLSSEQIGKDSKHEGKDGKDAIVYNIDVHLALVIHRRNARQLRF